MSDNPSVVEYGMRVVGKSLRYIRRGDFQGLIKLIHKRVYERWGVDSLKLEPGEETTKEILKKSAERLGSNVISIDSLSYGIELYKFLGMEEEAMKLEEKCRSAYDSWCERLSENQFLTI